MSRIPQEIDDLMWSVAESGDANAIEQFGERYPDYRAEMGKRLAMVRQFKASRPNQETAPRFNRPAMAARSPMRWSLAPAAAVLLAAVGFAAYQGATYFIQPKPKPVAEVRPINTAPVAVRDPINIEASQRDPNYRVFEPEPGAPKPIEPEVQPWEKPLTMKLTGVRLRDALQAIAVQGGLTLELAPGMPDVFVEMEYVGEMPMAILADMGRSFGFTALDQGRGRVLIIPEVDEQDAGPTGRQPQENAESGRSNAVEPPPSGG